MINLYTDGSWARGTGGWAALAITSDPFVIAGGAAETTNNRMELTAVIEGLSRIDPNEPVVIYTDSKYVMDGYTEWLPKWMANDWKANSGGEVANKDLWLKFYELGKGRYLQFVWVKAHSKNINTQYMGNNMVDQFATMIRKEYSRERKKQNRGK